MKSISFLHAADLHLDSPYLGLKHLPTPIFDRIQESTFVSFQNIVQLAIQKKVDFIILAGDLYDSEQRSLKAQIKLRDEFLRLQEEGIQVYIIHGNHDPLNGSWVPLKWPSNTHFFSENIESKSFHKNGELQATLYGFSYPDRSVLENMAKQYKRGVQEGYHIAILHGTVATNKDHNPYAPFQLTDLKNSGFDYWALGHIHQRQVLQQNPPVIYPGNIQGRHRKETGEKGCYYVEMNEAGTNYTFIETNSIIWETHEVQADNLINFDELLSLCKKEIEKLRRVNQGVIVQLKLVVNHELATIIQDQTEREMLIDLLLMNEESRSNFVWLHSIEYIEANARDRNSLKKDLHFYGDLLQQFDGFEDYEDILAPLYKHRDGRRLLSTLSVNDQSDLKQEAEKWVLDELLKYRP
ncbi:metallophosphoesterase family protein [Bacillus pinisoli]|uniref:metallophosphoesterase family protein n=1 Tax=Bacillus pinisoli TaxID=2901866 RepID=UPI001FF129A7|nr:DNA repair exonuclease [Bacillus pinisoli]